MIRKIQHNFSTIKRLEIERGKKLSVVIRLRLFANRYFNERLNLSLDHRNKMKIRGIYTTMTMISKDKHENQAKEILRDFLSQTCVLHEFKVCFVRANQDGKLSKQYSFKRLSGLTSEMQKFVDFNKKQKMRGKEEKELKDSAEQSRRNSQRAIDYYTHVVKANHI